MAIRKYMFDLDFDPPAAKPAASGPEATGEAEPPPPPPPAAPSFTEEDLQLAREVAFEDGRGAGLAEAAEASDRMLAAAMLALSTNMASLHDAQAEASDLNQRVAVRVAQAVLKKVLPAVCERHAFEEVTRVVEECLGHVLDEPRIIVRVSAPLVDPVRERIEAVALDHGFEGRVVVQPDARVVLGDCKVEWNDGGAERDQARLLRDIDETVERALAPPEKRPD
jgi:flagellar assembly protein FliH